jgi:hypothetical protein
MRILGRVVDERFFEFRRRSTSVAGIVAAVLALCLFEYRLLVNHRWELDLLAVGVAFVAVKLGLMAWYYLTQ